MQARPFARALAPVLGFRSPGQVAAATVAGESPMQRWYPESRLGGYTDIDGTVAFYGRVRALLPKKATVLDVGCGRGVHWNDPVAFRRELRTLRGRASRVIGVDVDRAGEGNPFLYEFRTISESGVFPLGEGECDFVVSDCVLEHVADPDFFFAECARVLRPGGRIAIRTTNAASYVGLLARLVPNRRHADVIKRVQDGRRDGQDVFPTVYRCNTTRKLRRALVRAGFDAAVYGYESEPRYFEFSRVLYGLAVMHQRFAPRALRVGLLAFGERQEV
jgi:SAM-dependent methyltransferase